MRHKFAILLNLSFSLTSNNKVLVIYFTSLLNYTIESCPSAKKKGFQIW